MSLQFWQSFNNTVLKELTALRVQFWHGDVAEKTFDGERTAFHSDRLKNGWPHAKKNEGEQ